MIPEVEQAIKKREENARWQAGVVHFLFLLVLLCAVMGQGASAIAFAICLHSLNQLEP